VDIDNRSGADESVVRRLAHHSSVSGESFLVFLDDKVNAVRAEFARAKLDEYTRKAWKPLPAWERDATGETDVNACTVSRRIIANQKLPTHAIDAIEGHELLVYLDGTWTRGPEMGFVLTLAHELRHAWQYFNAPVVFHSQTPLSWVVPPQLTPCELDAERAAKRVLGQMYGDSGLRAYIQAELASCKPEHRDVMDRLASLDATTDPQLEAKTISLLEEHAAEIRKIQTANSFVMPGIPELSDALLGRTDVQLRP